MSKSSRHAAAPILIAATAALAGGIFAAAPAVAEPDDPDVTSPGVGYSPSSPLSISTIDGLWNQYVPPIPMVPRSPVATFGPLVDEIFPIFR